MTSAPDRHEGPHYEGPQDHSRSYVGDRQIHITDSNQVSILYGTPRLPAELVGRPPRRAATPVNEESLRTLGKVFVRPERFELAERLFRANRVVAISGEPGSGRRSAAIALLSGLATSCAEMPNDLDDDDLPGYSDSVPSETGQLLDLSSRSPEGALDSLRRTESSRAALVAKNCPLAIVLPPDLEHRVTPELRRHLVTTQRPDGHAVFRKHLVAESVPHDVSDMDVEVLRERTDSEPMSELARLALLVRDAMSSAPEASVRKWLAQALELFDRQSQRVTKLFGDHEDGGRRALILATAMLNGGPTDAVFAATEDLLKVFEYPQDETHVLERSGISDRLTELGIRVDAVRRAQFPVRNLDHAVRTHFWSEYPALRGKLREWTGRVARLSMLDEQSRNGFVVRFAEQCLAVERPDDLRSLTGQWLRGPKPEAMLGCVELVLRVGLADERFGSWFRRLVYNWSTGQRNSRYPREFDLILIKLCADVIASTHPGQALVRLRHLFRNRDPDIREAALERIIDLAEDRFFFRRALHKLADSLSRQEDQHDVGLFLRIADAPRLVSAERRGQALINDGDVRSQLRTCWSAVLGRPAEEWREYALAWLVAAEGRQRPALLDVLVNAAEHRAVVLRRLHGIALRWARVPLDAAERAARMRTTADFAARIDAAQNLEFLTSTGDRSR